MSYADDMIDGMFENMWAMERIDRDGLDITENEVVRAYLYKRPLELVIRDTREVLDGLSPALREGRLPKTAHSIFIQGIAGKKLTDKQINALGLFITRYGD